jgi:hypothetical protein
MRRFVTCPHCGSEFRPSPQYAVVDLIEVEKNRWMTREDAVEWQSARERESTAR